MLNELTITELESYIKLCDRKREILYRIISANVADTKSREEYEKLYDASEILDKEFNKRIDKLIKDAEKA